MLLAAAIGLVVTGLQAPGGWVAQLREGDIIFQTSRSAQSVAVQRATGSRYSHMGIVLSRRGRPCIFEAISTVRCTRVSTWVARGQRGHFVVKRLRRADQILGPAASRRLGAIAAGFEGRPYDAAFRWSDEGLYCSELVWKIYDRALGVTLTALRRVGDFNLRDPVVREKARERYGRTLPVDEPAVEPSDIFDSTELVVVIER